MAGAASATVAEVARLVRLTATHDPRPAVDAGALLCDADLAILAADPAGYDTYAAAVRREYAHLPNEVFRAGRAAVLRSRAWAAGIVPGRRRGPTGSREPVPT